MKNDLELYDRCAADWWDVHSNFAASLHALNRVRLAEIRDRVGYGFRGVVADLGCGGGLLSEPLARDGATVIGVDISRQSLKAASEHGDDCPRLHYARGDARDAPLADGCADLVICADVIEHVADWPRVLSCAARLARPGGLFYVNTISRTWRARAVAIWLGEGLGFVPRGTHDHRLFVRPDELAREAKRSGWHFECALGQRIRPLRTLLSWRLSVAPSRGTWATYSAWMTLGQGP